MSMKPTLDFYLFIGSTYTYLSIDRIELEAEKAGVSIRWKPFFLRKILQDSGYTPFVGKPAKIAYMWRDIERRAAVHGIRYAGEPPYPVDPDGLANRVAYLASIEGWCPEYVKAIYRRWFLHHEVPGEVKALSAVISELGKDSDAVIAAANSDATVDGLAAATEAASHLGVFGSPTFVAGSEIFWGDDRLEDALEWVTGQHELIG